MSDPYLDTNVIVRWLTTDDLEQQRAATALLARVEQGKLRVRAPVTVIADAVYVLASPRLYRRSRQYIRDALAYLVSLPDFVIPQRRTVLRALDLYAETWVDFGDAMIAASMEEDGATVLYSFDRDFDRFPSITRQEPAPPGEHDAIDR